MLSFDINNDDLVSFLKVFGDAKRMTINFQGNEPQWALKMDGSHNIVRAFDKCIAEIRSTPRPDALSDDAIADLIVRRSRNRYYATGRPCACPYDKASNGSACGGRSAYSRAGGAEPLCYPSDVKPWMISQTRQQVQASR